MFGIDVSSGLLYFQAFSVRLLWTVLSFRRLAVALRFLCGGAGAHCSHDLGFAEADVVDERT